MPQPRKCMEINRRDDKRPLSLVHLSSAFVILIAGCMGSTISFVFETSTFYIFAQRRRTDVDVLKTEMIDESKPTTPTPQ